MGKGTAYVFSIVLRHAYESEEVGELGRLVSSVEKFVGSFEHLLGLVSGEDRLIIRPDVGVRDIVHPVFLGGDNSDVMPGASSGPE